MPELPDITIYVEAIERRVLGESLDDVKIRSPFLLRTFDPPLDSVKGKTVREIRRLGKRIALGLDDELWLVLHLMIAGRLHWKPVGVKLLAKSSLASFQFTSGCLQLTEAGTKHRASLYLLRGADAFGRTRPGRFRLLSATFDQFQAVLRQRNHTLKRALTDPRLFSGIGNAYSDEVLHRAVFLRSLCRRSSRQRRRSGSTMPRGMFSRNGSSVSEPRLEMAFPRKSPRFVRGWPCTAGLVNRVLSATPLCKESDTPTTKPTTAHAARRRGESWPTARSRVC